MKRLTADELAKTALLEMARRVGLEFDHYDDMRAWCDEQGRKWYQTHEWTTEQRDDFEAWFIDLLRTRGKMTKRAAIREWGWFNLMWGWKVSDGTTTQTEVK